jgi:AcrR family transcriptional regulator
MTKVNNNLILEKASEIFASGGLGEFRIRLLAIKSGIAPSVIYHYYKDEKSLLKAMFNYTNAELGKKRAMLPVSRNTESMLKQRINFQLDNADKIVAVLKYYLAFRKNFPKNNGGFIPDKSSLHMEEVLEFAKKEGIYKRNLLKDDAKVMTHAINGFLLEYFPYRVEGKEKTALVNRIYKFLYLSLKGGEN